MMSAQPDLIRSLSSLFGTLSHPVRVRILSLLSQQEVDVTHLQQALGVTQSSVSHHLHLLKSQGLVTDRRKGKHVFYRLKTPEVAQFLGHALNLLMIHLATEGELISACEEFLKIPSLV